MTETDWRARAEAGEFEALCTALLERYGGEIAGFLVAMLRDEDLAAESFSVFCEDLWKGLPKFRWQSSARTWMYTLARHAAHRTARDPKRKRDRNLPMSVVTAQSKLEQQLRASTAAYRKTAVKDQVRQLREQLKPDDQALLTLRLDRGLEWIEIAHVFLVEETADEVGGEAPVDFDPALVKKRSAALRKRFERVKERLKKLADEAGLLPKA